MSIKRLLGYAAIGIIAGLLLENSTLRFAGKVRTRASGIRNSARDLPRKAKKQLQTLGR